MQALKYDEAAEALRRWFLKHGYLPVWADWETATPDHPAAKSIPRRWGWREFLASALDVANGDVPGLQGASRGGPGGLVRTDSQLLADLKAFKAKNGRWPTYPEWVMGTTEHASSRTYARRFGWSRALQLAASYRWKLPPTRRSGDS
jgi:hypothetical protein